MRYISQKTKHKPIHTYINHEKFSKVPCLQGFAKVTDLVGLVAGVRTDVEVAIVHRGVPKFMKNSKIETVNRIQHTKYGFLLQNAICCSI